MLLNLSIRNAALVERAELSFSEGLNVLSGETGAGKSVILDCIDFALGAKADRTMIRSGEEECTVRAEFTAGEAVDSLLRELDIEPEETLILSRKLKTDGKGTLKINGVSVTLAMLRRVTSLLVDVHGQSEHFYLLKESNQLRLLDEIGRKAVAEQKETVHGILAERKEVLKEIKLLGGDEGERNRRLDILRYQIDEITRADIKEGEEESLLAYQTRYRNAEKILSGLNTVRELLLADGGSVDTLHSARHALSPITKYSHDYEEILERLENAGAELADLGDTVESYLSELDVDEREAERVENRLDEIKTLKKKYGGSVEATFAFLNSAQEEYELLSASGERSEQLTRELQVIDHRLFEACLKLTAARKKTAISFTERVTKELQSLNISAARFEIEFDDYTEADVPSATQEGLGGVRFLFSANAGEPLKELGKIISGGEMSRFMLAVKAQLSAVNKIGTYLFDEIDSGIGGKTARVVAEKFCNISRYVQIIAVSHLAQIAAFADREFLIEKKEIKGRAQTLIREVAGEDRTHEIARLVSGDTGETALRHAEELLEKAKTYKNSLN